MEDLIFGRNAVMELLKSGRSVNKIFMAEGSRDGSIQKILALAKTAGVVVEFTSREKLDKLCDGRHQGVAAEAAVVNYSTLEEILELAESRNELPFIILLDELEDPQNFGAILRTAEAVGVHGVIIPKRRSVRLNATVFKTSAGAAEYVKVAQVVNVAQTLKNLRGLDESLLMTIATLGAMALAIYEDGDYTEAIAVMLFYQIGEWFQSYAVGKSRKNISELMDIRPDYANVETADGLEQVDPDDVEVGTVIIVQPGEKIPIDGVIIAGNSTLNTVALTGESLPREVSEGAEVISGCININGVLKIRTTKDFGESTASKILELVEDASSRKSKSENFITKFARIYTPVVVACAVALAIIPPIFSGDWAFCWKAA